MRAAFVEEPSTPKPDAPRACVQAERDALTRAITVLRRITPADRLTAASPRYKLEQAQTTLMHERRRIADDLHDRVAQLLFSGELGPAS